MSLCAREKVGKRAAITHTDQGRLGPRTVAPITSDWGTVSAISSQNWGAGPSFVPPITAGWGEGPSSICGRPATRGTSPRKLPVSPAPADWKRAATLRISPKSPDWGKAPATTPIDRAISPTYPTTDRGTPLRYRRTGTSTTPTGARAAPVVSPVQLSENKKKKQRRGGSGTEVGPVAGYPGGRGPFPLSAAAANFSTSGGQRDCSLYRIPRKDSSALPHTAKSGREKFCQVQLLLKGFKSPHPHPLPPAAARVRDFRRYLPLWREKKIIKEGNSERN
jgi:hypothetical protein